MIPTKKIPVYRGQEPYIFVSYAHKNNDRVLPLLEKMFADGYRIWYDDGILSGTKWSNSIATHIKDCAYFIAMMSPEYIASDHCVAELDYAIKNKKYPLTVYFADTVLPPGLDMYLSPFQAIFQYKLSESEFFRRLYDAEGIDACLRVPAPPQPPQPPLPPQPPQPPPDLIHKTVTYSNGDTYNGEVSAADGKRNGHGRYRWKSGAVYEGEFRDGKKHGFGTQCYSDGSSYKGNWRNNQWNGQGIYHTPADSEVYEGEFKDGKRHGKGILCDSSSVYEGAWANDMRNGYGVYRDKNGKIFYQGNWKDNHPQP